MKAECLSWPAIVARTDPVHKVVATVRSTVWSWTRIGSMPDGANERKPSSRARQVSEQTQGVGFRAAGRQLDGVKLIRPLGIQLLAALLTAYTIGAFYLAVRVGMTHDERYRWWLIVGAGCAFAIASGVSALAVWRLERRAPLMLIICGVLGASFLLALPAAVPADQPGPTMWGSAILGAVLILAFLLLAAWYVRNVVRRA